MPDAFGRMNGRTCIISFVGEYKPGDMPPSGYCDWHEWAKVQHMAGLRQVRCDICSKFKYPQELARTEERASVVFRTKRDARHGTNPIHQIEDVPVCKSCD